MVGAACRLLLERDVDVVVSLTTPPLVATVGWIASRLRGARSICWVMDIYPELAFALGMLRRRSVVGRLLGVVGRATLLRSDAVVALGETMARTMREDGARRVIVIHNWADGEAIRPCRPADSPLRRAWGWGNRCVFLYSGNLGLAHEFDTVLAAAESLRDDPDVLFAFVGEGPRLHHVEREVARRRLGNVEFRPHVSRESLGDSLTAADVHLVTLRDGIAGLVVPSKIYGILAAGRPTLYVGPDAGEMVEILRDGGCGLRVAVGDGAALAEAIRRYAGDVQRRSAEGRRARRLFDERYTKQAALRAHQDVLESLVADLP
jgi:glycosyltransferase involved in cell wall biosynthesis